MLSAADLAMMQETVASLRTTSCVIQRYTGTWAAVSANGLTCQVSEDTQQYTIPNTDGLQQLRRWMIRLPAGQIVLRGDRILAQGYAYAVVELGSPPTIQLATIVYAYALWTINAQGNPTSPPLYLAFNAVVTVKKGVVVKLSAVQAMIATPGPETQPPLGGIVKYVVELAPLADVNDCRAGDSLLIDSWGANAVDTAEVYYVFESAPDGPLGMERQRLVIGYRQMNG